MVKKNVIKPRFIKQTNGFTSKYNTGTFYCHLYSKLFGGRILGANNPHIDNVQFIPDIVKETDKERTYTEVKSVSTRTSRTMCEVKQFKNYLEKAFEDMYHTKKTINSDYAFFRYSDRVESKKFSELKLSELREELSERTKGVIITPLNLTIMILLNSQKVSLYRTEPKLKETKRTKREYWRVPGSLIQNLGDYPFETINRMGNESRYDENTIEKLFLKSGIQYERYVIDNAYCGRTKIQPFVVTRFFNKEPERLEKKLKFYHPRIFENILKINN